MSDMMYGAAYNKAQRKVDSARAEVAAIKKVWIMGTVSIALVPVFIVITTVLATMGFSGLAVGAGGMIAFCAVLGIGLYMYHYMDAKAWYGTSSYDWDYKPRHQGKKDKLERALEELDKQSELAMKSLSAELKAKEKTVWVKNV